LRIPFVATIPESPYYALADQQGLSIFEWSEGYAALDRAAWQPLLDWLDSRRSRPR
jgi:chromosome partitioning protein